MRRRILLGLTGSVATVLYEKLIEELRKLGDVSVILTEKAEHFVSNDFLKGVNVFKEKDEWEWKHPDFVGNEGWFLDKYWHKNDPVLHIELRNNYSALVIAPCSANTLAKISYGLCDNLLTTVARAWDFTRPFIVAPAMNTAMWDNPTTSEHTQQLVNRGIRVIDPQKKMLACKTYGYGALANIEDIVRITKNNLLWGPPMDPEAIAGIPIGNHPGAFACSRKHGVHTGIDIYTKPHQLVWAMESGTVVAIEHFTGEWDKSPWWNDTDCVLVEGATGVICYGEVSVPNWIRVGTKVKKGDYIANVIPVLKDEKPRKDIPGHSTSMLHLELYSHGQYHVSDGFDPNILRNPTPYLLESNFANTIKKLTYD
jgi:phosphopantothenoylcysteine decarboxylase